jgi:NhaP-type Na+/H+ or K+/H+ antiporter
MSTQIMMFGAGLRGAVALALVMQMPTSSAEEIASATLFVVFWTNIVLGGLTTPMVLWLKVCEVS